MDRRLFRILIPFLLISVFCGCVKRETLYLKKAGQDEILYTSLKQTCDSKELNDYLQKDPSLEEVCGKFQIGDYKQIGSSRYIVIKTSEGLAAVFFADTDLSVDGSMNYDVPILHNDIIWVTFSDDGDQDFFKGSIVGRSLEAVRLADASGQYPFLYRSWSGYPKYSYHSFASGDCYTVYYDDNYLVSDVFHFTI